MAERPELSDRPDLQEIYKKTQQSLGGEFVYSLGQISVEDRDAYPYSIIVEALSSSEFPTESRDVVILALRDYFDSVTDESKILLSQNPLANSDELPNDQLAKKIHSLANVISFARPPELEKQTEQNFVFALEQMEKNHGSFASGYLLESAIAYRGYINADNYAALWKRASRHPSLWAMAHDALLETENPDPEILDKLLTNVIKRDAAEDTSFAPSAARILMSMKSPIGQESAIRVINSVRTGEIIPPDKLTDFNQQIDDVKLSFFQTAS